MRNKSLKGFQMKKVSSTIASKLTIAALVGMSVVELISVLLLEGENPPIALFIELFLLALAALVYTGRWWASALAAGLSGLFALFTLTGSISTLTQPRSPGFISAVLFLGLALVATIAGIRATVQNFRNTRLVQR